VKEGERLIGLRVLGVSGSPREGGNTDAAVMEALAVASDLGYRVEFQRLADYRIEHCRGCRACMRTGTCAITGDELAAALNPWRAADVVILGSPVYWLAPSGLLKDFIDRTHGWYAEGNLFRGKRAILLSVAADSGFEPHDEGIAGWLRHYGAEVPAVVRILARDKGDFNKRPEEREKVRETVAKVLRGMA
jgi:multimeric flavodoxin WrbA